MYIKVRGIAAARLAAGIMERETGRRTRYSRCDETGGVYGVSNTWLDPRGEQMVLEILPEGSLIEVHGCSHQRQPAPPPAPSANGKPKKITPAVRERLLALAKTFKVTAEVDLDDLSPEPPEERLT